MKKFLFGVGLLALAAAVQPAAAADLKAPVYKAPPPIVEVWSWTGFYIGGNAGYSWGKSDTTLSFYNNTNGVLLDSTSGKFDMNGWVAGGQVGYNWQSGNFVWGLELDAQATGQKGDELLRCTEAVCTSTAVPGSPGIGVGFSQKLDWFGTVRLRAGVTVTPTVLAYVTGGFAYGQVDTDLVVSGFTGGGVAVVEAFSHDKTKAGWTVGGGLEGRISGNWTAKIEYLYVDLGSVSGTAVTTSVVNTFATPFRITHSSDITDNIVRVGLNYKFGGPSQVVAKY